MRHKVLIPLLLGWTVGSAWAQPADDWYLHRPSTTEERAETGALNREYRGGAGGGEYIYDGFAQAQAQYQWEMDRFRAAQARYDREMDLYAHLRSPYQGRRPAYQQPYPRQHLRSPQ